MVLHQVALESSVMKSLVRDLRALRERVRLLPCLGESKKVVVQVPAAGKVAGRKLARSEYPDEVANAFKEISSQLTSWFRSGHCSSLHLTKHAQTTSCKLQSARAAEAQNQLHPDCLNHLLGFFDQMQPSGRIFFEKSSDVAAFFATLFLP
ncbi:hypothetical protein Ciccas_011347 [Cichlidogyrus casuarinus]|uniref:Uncharacterized protein n=1 Tax=Cichlidogyrus casuarinus TaxID=1844966 RepID=A0ABD2PSQ3_9PLAT